MEKGDKVTFSEGKLVVPDRPVIPFIEGDGTGPDIWRAARKVLDRAVEICWKGRRQIVWKEVLRARKRSRRLGSGSLPRPSTISGNTGWASRDPSPPR